MNHGVPHGFQFLRTGQGELNLRQVVLIIFGNHHSGLHLIANAVPFTGQDLEDDILLRLVDRIVDSLHLDSHCATAPWHAHPIRNTDIVRLIVCRTGDGQVDFNLISAPIVSRQCHRGGTASLCRLVCTIQRQSDHWQ